MGPKAAVEVVGLEIRKLLACFYVDNRIIALHDLTFFQECIDKLAALLNRVGLVTATTKTEAMTILPGKIRGCFLWETYKMRMDRTAIEGTKRRIPCKKCGTMLVEGSIRKHMETQHDVFNLYRSRRQGHGAADFHGAHRPAQKVVLPRQLPLPAHNRLLGTAPPSLPALPTSHAGVPAPQHPCPMRELWHVDFRGGICWGGGLHEASATCHRMAVR